MNMNIKCPKYPIYPAPLFVGIEEQKLNHDAHDADHQLAAQHTNYTQCIPVVVL